MSSYHHITSFLALVIILLASPTAFAEDTPDDEPDYIQLASMLLRDGHHERAQRELAKVDTSADADFDRPTYYTLKGLIALERKTYKSAVDHFDDAIRHGKTDKMIYVYLAQAHYHLRDWERTASSVDSAGETGEEIPDMHLMKAHAHRQLGEHPQAWGALEAGAERFPERADFMRRQVLLLVEMDLFRKAAEIGQAFLARDDSQVDDYLALGEAFRKAGAFERAQRLLEGARLRYPAESKITVHLAHAYMADGHLIAAGELMQRAAHTDPKYIQESAELYRRAGAFERALYMNSQVSDQPAKFKQRAAILLDQKRFEELATLEARLAKLGLFEDQKLIYTLAYAHFKNGNYDRAERLLGQISDAELFESAVQLRRTVQLCTEEPWKC
ncbi:MAG: tetratricopeptide repeat protein [Persicimonas sp.]